jgi:hypothetical protein
MASISDTEIAGPVAAIPFLLGTEEFKDGHFREANTLSLTVDSSHPYRERGVRAG